MAERTAAVDRSAAFSKTFTANVNPHPLREELIKLANEKPELRSHLMPVLERTAAEEMTAAKSPAPATPSADDVSMRRMLDYQRSRTIEQVYKECETALATMEGFIKEARREIERCRMDVHEKPARTNMFLAKLPADVSHQLSWGAANAASHLKNATSSAYEVAELEQD